jgi:hypothetical protein
LDCHSRSKFYFSGGMMCGRRLVVPLAIETAILFSSWPALSMSAALSAGSDPGGHHQPGLVKVGADRTAHGRAGDPGGSTSVGLRVLPVSSSPTRSMPERGEPPPNGWDDKGDGMSSGSGSSTETSTGTSTGGPGGSSSETSTDEETDSSQSSDGSSSSSSSSSSTSSSSSDDSGG